MAHDGNCIKLIALRAIIDPENPIRICKVRHHVRTQDVVISLDLRNHIVRDNDHNIPLPWDISYVCIHGFYFSFTITVIDLSPCSYVRYVLNAPLNLSRCHRQIVKITANTDTQ